MAISRTISIVTASASNRWASNNTKAERDTSIQPKVCVCVLGGGGWGGGAVATSSTNRAGG